MKKILTCLAIALALGACEPRGRGGPAAPSADDSPNQIGARTILYSSPKGEHTYVIPGTENACAPEPQRFVSIIGEVTYRVKDCVKDEWDYYPESQRRRIDALVKQCQTKCAAAAPATPPPPAVPPAPAVTPAKR